MKCLNLITLFTTILLTISVQAEGVTEFTKKAEQGDSDAQNDLAVMYDYGQGTSKNDKKYTESAKQGNSTAQYNLGNIYHTGKGTPKNYRKAYEWMLISDANEVDETKMFGESLTEEVEHHLTTTQITQIQDLAANCMNFHYKKCD